MKEKRKTGRPAIVEFSSRTAGTFERCPKAPEDLSAAAREVWERLAPVLWDEGNLTPLDYDSFKDYCFLSGYVNELRREIARTGAAPMIEIRNKKGSIRQVMNPIIRTFVILSKVLQDMGKSFGLNPTARQRLKANKSYASRRVLGLD
ncbi:MAG TPA: phage terminase small subunit P27 family [Candidatus Sumerlaeia bacterium]|nr:MAG: Phage terminase, small subunit [candidate division BRC1 bacterium ADurb.Bin183]HRR32441.1 phage terminase small subunit P27 family [Candidatus Sumerlaeia bacterium]HRR99976.1 phage terminase small subunit P27 family [Candidatus Sumerlaeia bacterium]